MLNKAESPETELDREYKRALVELKKHTAATDEYARVLNQIARLQELREEQTSKPISKDTLVMVGANLLGIVMIITHERANVITTKALSFVPKLR